MYTYGLPQWFKDKESTYNAGDMAGAMGSIPTSEYPMEKEMANHSHSLVWRIPWTEEPGGPNESMGLQRVGHR